MSAKHTRVRSVSYPAEEICTGDLAIPGDTSKTTDKSNDCACNVEKKDVGLLTNSNSNDRIEQIKRILDAPTPPDYEKLSEELSELGQAVRREIAARLEPALRAKMAGMPHGDIADKQELAKWVNGELRHHGLAIGWIVRNGTDDEEVSSTYPAILVTDPGYHPKVGRFQIHCKNEHGKVLKPLSTPSLDVLLGAIKLVDDDPDRRRWGKWTDQVKREPRGRIVS